MPRSESAASIADARAGFLQAMHPLAPSSKYRSARIVAERFHHMGEYDGVTVGLQAEAWW